MLSVLLVVAIVGGLGTLGYVIGKPRVEERFTEFYILGPEGKPEGYPKEFTLSKGKVFSVKYAEASGIPKLEAEGKVIMGVVNQEHQTTDYRVEITIDGERVWRGEPLTLQQEQKWEQAVSLIPVKIGAAQKVEFLLYKGVNTEPYRTLHLWIDVRESS